MLTKDQEEKMNLGDFERKASVVGGAAFVLWALKHGSFGSLVSAMLGAGLMMRGITGRSRIYDLLNYDSRERHPLPPEPPVPEKPAPSAAGAAPETAAAVSETDEKLSRAELQKLSKSELYEMAKERDIPGRSAMGKKQLIDALRQKS